MLIRFAAVEDIPSIKALAEQIWWPTYNNVLSPEQISFMLDNIYSEKALRQQFEQQHSFIIIEDEEHQAKGFASFSLHDSENNIYKVHKLYLHPDTQGKGLGKIALNFLKAEILTRGGKIMELNVNRNNPALHFYQKNGFVIFNEVDIPYGKYILDDYVLRLDLRT